MPSLQDPKIGDVFDQKYHLTSLLGEGGMGKVFAAEHQWMGHQVAVKILTVETLAVPGAFQRLQQEALAASKMEHANIAKVLDFGVDRDTSLPYIVMERLIGMTLYDYLEDSPGGRIGRDEALGYALPIMGALVAAHRLGIVHRDLKPGNIFLSLELDGSFTPKVIDFGIAKALTPLLKDALRTGTGQAVGTPSYMAREQAAGQSDIDGRVDVWAVGLLLYEMLSGKLPYSGGNSNVIMAKILYEDPVPLEECFPEVDPETARVIRRALRPDRDDRYATMRAFMADLLEVSGPSVRGALSPQTLETAGAGPSPRSSMSDAPPVQATVTPEASPEASELEQIPETAEAPPRKQTTWWALTLILCAASAAIYLGTR